ncbi:MAG: hypothetical protein U5J64_08815 [Halobacteriales archaeon]|nr:hypothetical protein [Halobacteriales archaeon]
MTSSIIETLRQPEYTGENRCLPCTAVNTVIALFAGTAVGVLFATFVSTTSGVGAGLAFFGLSATAIYLRGYLVPGTPELTKRYFPPWLLRAFGKEPKPATGPTSETTTRTTTQTRFRGNDPSRDFDPETELVEADALEECETGDDLCLTDGFREAWYDEMERAAESERDGLFELLEVEHAGIDFEEYENGFRARAEGTTVGVWESEAAYEADLAAGRVLLETYDGWAELPTQDRSRFLTGLRIFLDRCPNCGGEPEFGSETVESCCSTREVAAVSCTDCGSRLFESPV